MASMLGRFSVDASLHRLHSDDEELAARRDTLRPLVVARLYGLSLLDLHRLLHHGRPVLLDPAAGQLSSMADQAQDTY